MSCSAGTGFNTPDTVAYQGLLSPGEEEQAVFYKFLISVFSVLKVICYPVHQVGVLLKDFLNLCKSNLLSLCANKHKEMRWITLEESIKSELL